MDHWLAINAKMRATAAKGDAMQRTVAFLVKAQWLLQEATSEHINPRVLERVISERIAGGPRSPSSGMTRADTAFQIRLDVISSALAARHSHASVSTADVARYYAQQRGRFVNPAVRRTLMIVTSTRTTALRARAALLSGESWAAVANRWSVDSSKLNGGAYAVVEGVQSSALFRAAFAAQPRRIIGPVRAPLAAQPSVLAYFVFQVIGGHRRSQSPLSDVAVEIRQKLGEQASRRALDSFTSAYERRWRSRTLCAHEYLVPECRNYYRSASLTHRNHRSYATIR